MKFRAIIPYVVLGAAFLMPYKLSMGKVVASYGAKDDWHFDSDAKYKIEYALLDKKASELRDIYVANSINGREHLNQMKTQKGYSAAVRSELPGAPVGNHCLYGQYLQLSRALDQQGDTLTIIPQGAHQSCVNFKSQMRNKYNAPEYEGCIKEGRMFASKDAYQAALDKYLARKKIDENTPDSVRVAAISKFAESNFIADNLDSGTVLVVPRVRGAKNLFHAIMLLGRGNVVDGKFVPDENGEHIYTGYNREQMGELFRHYDTSNVFAADVKKIAQAEYSRELEHIKSMPRADLVRFLEENNSRGTVLGGRTLPREYLVNAACAKYFNRPIGLNPVSNIANVDIKPAQRDMVLNIARAKKLEKLH